MHQKRVFCSAQLVIKPRRKLKKKDSYYYYDKAALSGDDDLKVKIGITLFDDGREEQAAKYFLMAAKTNNAEAQNLLAYMYAQGSGVLRDNELAFKYYFSAAAQGHPEAQFNLANLYRDGRGCEKDLFSALWNYQLAKVNGIGQAKAKFDALELKLRNDLNEEYRELYKVNNNVRYESCFSKRNQSSKIRRQSSHAKTSTSFKSPRKPEPLKFYDEVEAIFFMKDLNNWLKEVNAQWRETLELQKGNDAFSLEQKAQRDIARRHYRKSI